MRVVLNKTKATKIGQWEFSPIVCNRLVGMVHRHLSHKECAAFCNQVTIGEVMAAIEGIPVRGGLVESDSGWVVAFKEMLKKSGMTPKEWPYLGTPSEIQVWLVKQAAAKSKADLLKLNVRMLGRCVSSRVIERLEYVLERSILEVTIGHVIALDPARWVTKYVPYVHDSLRHHPYGDVHNGVQSMRKKLVELGLGYDDGPFFQQRSLRKEVEKLCGELRITKKAAKQFLDYAKKNGWGPKVEQ